MPRTSLRYRLPAVIILCLMLNLTGWLVCATNSFTRATGLTGDRQRTLLEDHPASDNQSASQPGSTDNEIPVDVSPAARLHIQGILTPVFISAGNATLSDHELVIGLEFDGQARAYAIDSFAVKKLTEPDDLAVHVVHDVIGGQPFCITHCDISHSTRVLTQHHTDQSGNQRLALGVGGWDNGMVLVLDGIRYHHHSRQLPLKDFRFVTTTWREWVTTHPETVVYHGNANL